MAKYNLVFRFNVTNPVANRRIEQLAGKKIVEITDDVREAAKETILHGYAAGRGPRDIALDLIGRVNRHTGGREGGMVGLTGNQAAAARNFRQRLESGVPGEMAKALDMKLRDKRFDSTVLKHIEAGKALPQDVINRMYGRYVDNALRLRGETISRTETGKAVHEAAHESFRQGLEKTGYSPDAVVRTWRSAGDRRVRDSHQEMDGQTVRGLNTPFKTPAGALMMHPLDASLGAGPEEIINCRCDEEINIDFARGR